MSYFRKKPKEALGFVVADIVIEILSKNNLLQRAVMVGMFEFEHGKKTMTWKLIPLTLKELEDLHMEIVQRIQLKV